MLDIKLAQRLLSVGLVASLCLTAAPARSQTNGAEDAAVVTVRQPIVRSIEINGLENVPRERVERALRVKEGEELPRMAPGQMIKAVYSLGYFQPDIRIEQEKVDENGVKLIVTLQENPTIGKIVIDGARAVKEKDLRYAIAKYYKEGDVLRSSAAEEVRSALLGYYHRKGYTQASARVKISPDPDKPDHVVIHATAIEGARRLLKDIVIEGNESVGAFWLRLRMDNRGSWGPFTNYYDDYAMTDDLERIRNYYINRGYLGVEVELEELKTGGEGKNMWISPVIHIDEGPRYVVGGVVVKGASVFSETEILDEFRPLVDKTYSGPKLRKALDAVTRMYGDEGYVNAQMDLDYRTDPQSGRVNLTLDLKERSQVRIGRVLVQRAAPVDDQSGSTWRQWYLNLTPPLKEDAILREVKLESGDTYRTFNEVRSRRRLENLGVFDEVKIRREPTADPNVDDVVIEVEDADNTGWLTFGIGYDSVDQAFVQVNYTERNLFGEAKDLNATAYVSMRGFSGSASYLDRHLGDSDYRMEVEAFFKRFREEGYTQQNLGGAISLGHPLGDQDSYKVRLKAYHVALDPEDDNDETEEDLDKQYFVASLRPSVTFADIDNKDFPRRGYSAAFAVEGGVADGPLGKLETDLQGYAPLPAKFVWSPRFRFGTLMTDADEIGISERYFLGGPSSLRGYKRRGVGPKDPLDDDVAIGGASVALLQNELRYPIVDNLSVLLFHDIGWIGRDLMDFEAPRNAIGVGGRFKTRAVSVGADLGFALDETDTDETEIFQFRVGANF